MSENGPSHEHSVKAIEADKHSCWREKTSRLHIFVRVEGRNAGAGPWPQDGRSPDWYDVTRFGGRSRGYRFGSLRADRDAPVQLVLFQLHLKQQPRVVALVSFDDILQGVKMRSVSADVDDGGCLPPLNSPNLLKLGSSITDKNTFLRSYIRSQEAHLASYVVQGKSGAPSIDDIRTPKKTKTVLRDFEIESGFGTPILKHRTFSRPTDPTPPIRKSGLEDVSERVSVAPGRVKHGDDTQQDKTVVERSGRPRERAVDPNISRKAKNLPEQLPTTINDKGQARKSTEKDKCERAETNKRKHRDSGSDDEHRNRTRGSLPSL